MVQIVLGVALGLALLAGFVGYLPATMRDSVPPRTQPDQRHDAGPRPRAARLADPLPEGGRGGGPGAAGIIVQFPLYAGVMGMMAASGLLAMFADVANRLSTPTTLPL